MRIIPVAVMALVMVMGVGLGPLAYADQATYSVGIPSGTSVKGCEVDNRCYIPADVTVDVGGEVTWSNDDSAAHTVTSGALSDDDYGSMFDSGLFLSGATFSVTFDEQGEFPYFCLVHPWMEGSVIVNMDAPRPEPEIPEMPETSEVPRTSGSLESQNPDDMMMEPEEIPESLEPDIGLVEPEVIPDPIDRDAQDTRNDQDSQNKGIQVDSAPIPETAPEAIPEPEPAAADSGLEERVDELEGRVGILESILDSLRSFFGF